MSIQRLFNAHKSSLNRLFPEPLPTQQAARVPREASIVGSQDLWWNETPWLQPPPQESPRFFAQRGLQLPHVDPFDACHSPLSPPHLLGGWGAAAGSALDGAKADRSGRTAASSVWLQDTGGTRGFSPLPLHRNSGSCHSPQERTPQLSSRKASPGPKTCPAAAALQRASLLTTCLAQSRGAGSQRSQAPSLS